MDVIKDITVKTIIDQAIVDLQLFADFKSYNAIIIVYPDGVTEQYAKYFHSFEDICKMIAESNQHYDDDEPVLITLKKVE